MAANDLVGRIGSLEERLTALEARLAAMANGKAAANHAVAPPAAPAEPIHPWKLDANHLFALTDDLYAAVKADPCAAFSFDRNGSNYLDAHARNVSKMGMFIAAQHGFSEASVRAIGLCGLLHDAGMDSLPHDFVRQGRPLTPEEYRQVRLHPRAGADYVRQHFRFQGLLDTVVPAAVEQHHERFDGSGYPQGLAGDKIHNFARVLAIADSFEAMSTPRPFRAPMDQPEAMRSLLVQGWRSAGGMYDPDMLKTFVWAASLYPLGSDVKLSDGRRVRVIAATDDPKSPVVRTIPDGAGPEETIDLSKNRHVSVAG